MRAAPAAARAGCDGVGEHGEIMNEAASETREHRLKRLQMRSWRRGTKEMDMILGPYSDAEIAKLSSDALDAYESLLSENDQDLYQWVSGQVPMPSEHTEILERIRLYHRIW